MNGGISDRVVPAERHIYCSRCRMSVTGVLSEVGPHIRSDCPDCGNYLKFVKQIKDHPFDREPELYEEAMPW